MPSHRRPRPLLLALLVALMVVPPVSIVASLPWLRQQADETVFLFTGIASALTVIASLLLAMLQDRHIDEWQRANVRFSSQWGWTAGASLVALLLALPPFRDWIVSVVASVAQAPNADQKLVVLTFTFGFMTVIVAQIVCIAALSLAWTFWKSRAAREPS
jgi:hypothetical protein